MKLFFSDQKNNLKSHLDFLKSSRVMTIDKTVLIEKTTSIVLNTSMSLHQLDLDFLFNYQIFPNYIMAFKTQWEDEKRKMKIGDTIVQQAYLPPIPSFSQKILFGVRISEIIDEPNRKGYSYETLEGHVEKGISTFTVEQNSNQLIFKIHTHSVPGNFLSKLFGPIFSIPYQSYCTMKALRNVKRFIE
jgi:hypothetical protein